MKRRRHGMNGGLALFAGSRTLRVRKEPVSWRLADHYLAGNGVGL